MTRAPSLLLFLFLFLNPPPAGVPCAATRTSPRRRDSRVSYCCDRYHVVFTTT